MDAVSNELHVTFAGKMAAFFVDATKFIDLEGAFRSGKTTAACWKVFQSCVDDPGIHWLVCRYGDGDTKSKLKPVFQRICADAGYSPAWHPQEQFFEFSNGSRVYCMGLKAQDQVSRYAKLRGLTLAKIYVDQAEELPNDVYLELKGRMSQSGHPHQLILTPNPPDEDHWIAKTEFPEDNHRAHHKYYSVSIYDNAHNLPSETIPDLVGAYPPGHIKHRSAILGRRGLNVIGEPVYGPLDMTRPETAAFHRELHVRALAMDPSLPLYEALDFGRHHPCVVWAQYTPYAEVRYLGGILGQNMHLEDFAPIVQQYRERLFHGYLEVATCCDPSGGGNTGMRNDAIQLLKDLGFALTYKPHSNTPPVHFAMIERIAGYMRRRTPKGEAFGVNTTNFYRLNAQGVTEQAFLADGFEAGYVWDVHTVSHGGKIYRRAKADGWYDHGQKCTQYLEDNFGGVQPTWEQQMRRAERVRNREDMKVKRDYDPADRRLYPVRTRRGGY